MTVLLQVVLLGIVAGAVTTSTGIGWGIVSVPMLLLYFQLPPSSAVAASIIGGLACGGMFTLARMRTGSIDWWVTVALSVGGGIGVALGTVIDAYLPAVALRKIIGVATILAGIVIVFHKT